MKKIAVAAIAVFVSLSAMPDTVTNTVVIVSNIYNRIVREVTNNVKNTHSNYFYTNNIYTIEHQTLVVSKTNTTINLDVSQQAIDSARQYADQSSTYANNSSASATRSANSASSASGSASQAYSYLSQTRSAASSAVSDINSAKSSAITAIGNEKAWFSENFGKMVTNNNFYSADKLIARGGNIYGTHKYVLYINGIKHPEHWVIIDFNTYSLASSGNTTWVYTIWSQSSENKTSNHSYIYKQTLHASYPSGLIRDERSGRNYFNLFTSSSGYAVAEAYQGSLINPRNAYPNRVLTHLKYSGYEYRIDDDPYWDVNADLRITDPNTGVVIDKVSKMSELEALSNWVERVFQKK